MAEMGDDRVQVVFFPDYIDYHGTHYVDSVVSFSRGSVEVTSKTIYGKEETFRVHLEIEDIIKIESQWSARYESGTINIHFVSKDTSQSDTRHASEVKELKFPAADTNWCEKHEAIESLDIRYKALWNVLLDTGMETSSALSDMKDTMLFRKYFPNFNKPFGEVIYPKGDPDAVSISKRDIDLLCPDTFVNDTIIDFYIKYLKTKLNAEQRIKFHFFNSFFFRKLADMDKDPSSAFDGKAAFHRVRKWTRKVNLLEKDFIFIPVNYNYHWSLIVICYFGEVGSYEDAEREKSARVPCVLHMDSIKGSHTGLKDLMQSYLWEEWKERQKETCEDLHSKFSNLKFVSLELPQQQNSYDCGLFLLHYVELFLEDVSANFSVYKITSSSKFLQADWFPPGEASMKRTHIERLIDDLLDSHADDCLSSDGSDKHCSPGSPTTNFNSENGAGFSEKCGHVRGFDRMSQCSDAGEGVEMSQLNEPSIRISECTRGTGLVLKELFEMGSAVESFNDTQWGSFEHREPVNEFRQLSTTEEVGAGKCFLQTEFVDPTFQDLDGVTTAPPSVPDMTAEFHPELSNRPSLENDSFPIASDCGADDISGLKAGGKGLSLSAGSLEVELESQRCISPENIECSTVCYPLASGEMLVSGESCRPLEISFHNDDSLKNLPGVDSEENHLQAGHPSSSGYLPNLSEFAASGEKLDILEPAVNSDSREYPCTTESPLPSHQGNGMQVETHYGEPLSELDENHAAKKRRLEPHDGEDLASNFCKDLNV